MEVYHATAAAVDDHTKNLEAAKGCYICHNDRADFLQVSLSAFLLPLVAQIVYMTRYSLYQQNLFKPWI